MSRVEGQVADFYSLEGEAAAVNRAQQIITCVQEQIAKRQYLNAASAANELVRVLHSALSSVLKERP